jgi:LPPG:FO 2-phospho-L-lactate transferase
MLGKLGMETWFSLGDRDLAVHVARTSLLKNGKTLSLATAEICRKLGLKTRIIPMSDDAVRTKVATAHGLLDFQEYFVKRKAEDEVTEVLYEGAQSAKPAPGVVESIREAERIVICPSNPILSIAPILSIPGVRDGLKYSDAYVVGISPIVGGKAVKGPADCIMASMGLEVSASGVARLYKDCLDHFIIDEVDAAQKIAIQKIGMKATITRTLMKNIDDSVRLARTVLEADGVNG